MGGVTLNARKLFALFMVLALTGGALAAQQQNTYRCDKSDYDSSTGGGGGYTDANCDPLEAEDVTAIQQHSVFVEIVVEDAEDKDNDNDDIDRNNESHAFGAVVGLVKKCKVNYYDDEYRQGYGANFDNAVLWFNDQFLFGDKNSTKDISVQQPQPDENVTDKGLGYNDGTFMKRSGTDQGRWEGCYIPDGFIHAIGSDDPFATGVGYDADVAGDDTDSSYGQGGTTNGDNIDFVKSLIDTDNADNCRGCIFEYHSTFYIVDPNGNNWMVDKLYYPVTMGDPYEAGTMLGEVTGNDHQGGNAFDNGADSGNCQDSSNNGNAAGVEDDPARSGDTEGHAQECTDASGDNRDNHRASSGTGSGDYNGGQYNAEGSGGGYAPTTLDEPIFTTHIQVDPTTPTNAGFTDTATWAYEDGDTRAGMPYPDDPSDGNYQACKDGTATQECSIEYNFLIAVDFDAFDNKNYCDEGGGDSCEEANQPASYDANDGENEVEKDAVHHGNGGADAGDSAEDGNSHPHNAGADSFTPVDTTGDGTEDACQEGSNGVADVNDQIDTDGDGAYDSNCASQSPAHTHDAVNLDLFFYASAPFYVEQNPYWSDAFGGVPTWTDDCLDLDTASTGADATKQQEAIAARTPIVCDADADDGYHLHDGTQTPTYS